MRWNILSLATGVSICRDCAADLHISEYEHRMWGKRYDQLWPRVKLATSARVGFLQRFQSPPLLSHTWPHPSACHLLAAILKVKLISRHQGLQLDSRALRAVWYQSSKENFSLKSPSISSSAQSGLRWKQCEECRWGGKRVKTQWSKE